MKNPQLTQLIKDLRKLSIEQNVKIWKRVADDLAKSTRRKRVIDVSQFSKTVKKGETAVVPGKVLGTSKTDVTIAAYQFSATVKNNNKVLSLRDLMNKNPKGQKCRIMG